MIKGYVDLIDRQQVSGWVADADKPSEPVEIAVDVDGVRVASLHADRPRKDLQALDGYGEGHHGFVLRFEPPLSATQDHDVAVRLVAGGRNLPHGHALLRMDAQAGAGVQTPPVVYAPELSAQAGPKGGPRYIIHVGPHKTGSKYLQKGFFALRDQLFIRGIHYPTNWMDRDNHSHAHLIARLKVETDTQLDAEFAALNRSDYQTIILSSEDIVDLPKPSLERLKRLLGEQEAGLIFYCRRWSELIPSGWQEIVKQGSSDSLMEFLAAHLINPAGSTLANFDQALGRLAEVFGVSSLHLVSYSNLVSANIDLLAHFLEIFAGWDGPVREPQERENVSLDIFDTELIRALNTMEALRLGRRSGQLSNRYLAMKRSLDLTGIRQAMQQHVRTVEINEGSTGLRVLHEAIFLRYGDRLVAPRSGFNFFGLEARPIRYVHDSYLLADGMADAIGQIYSVVGGTS